MGFKIGSSSFDLDRAAVESYGKAHCYIDAGFYESYPRTGTTWYDISGNSNNATLTNGPTWVDEAGGAFYFDGVDDYCDIGLSTADIDNASGDWTMVVALKKQGKIGNVSDATEINGDIVIGNDVVSDFGIIYYKSSGNGTFSRPIENKAFGADQWVILAVGHENSTNTIFSQVNNFDRNTASLSPDNYASTTKHFTIGYIGYGASYYEMTCAFVMSYNRVLTDLEVKTIFHGCRSRFGY